MLELMDLMDLKKPGQLCQSCQEQKLPTADLQ